MNLDRIDVSGIKLYAYHGCMVEEGRIGSDYEVNVSIWADLSHSAQTDHLSDTVDYVHLNKIVSEEMAIRAKLLETVNERICKRILEEIPAVQELEVGVSKITPPINGDVDRVSVVFRRKRI